MPHRYLKLTLKPWTQTWGLASSGLGFGPFEDYFSWQGVYTRKSLNEVTKILAHIHTLILSHTLLLRCFSFAISVWLHWQSIYISGNKAKSTNKNNIIAGESVSLATIATTNQRTNYFALGFFCLSVSLSLQSETGSIWAKSTNVCLPKKNQQIPTQW